MSTVTTATISEAVRNAFDFTVDKFPLSGPDRMATPHYGLFRSDSHECVGRPCAKGYVPHTTDDVCAIAEAVETVFGDCESRVETHFSNAHYVQICPTHKYRRDVFNRNHGTQGGHHYIANRGTEATPDSIWPRIVIRAGYDATSFRCSIGLYRDLCRNMTMLQTLSETETRIRHDSNLRGKMDALVEQLQGLHAGWDSVHDLALQMDRREIIVADFLHQLYGSPDEATSQRAQTYHRNRTDAILNRLVREYAATGRDLAQVEAGRATGWMLFNAVQGFAQHTQRRTSDNMMARVFAADRDRYVRQAATLATSFDLAS